MGQDDVTGCGPACVTTLAKVSFQEIKTIALGMGITVTDSRLWSDTGSVQTQGHQNGIQALSEELPDCFLENPAFPCTPCHEIGPQKNQAF